MDLSLSTSGLNRYKSASQRARVATELWGATNFYCPACESPRLNAARPNSAAIDYVCPTCESAFELKSRSKGFGDRIVDSAYSAMRRAILEDRTPNLYVLDYNLPDWTVRTVTLIPRFAFTLSAIECRKPLASTARRAGWVGCNILLNRMPADARISVIREGRALPRREVRAAYERLRPLQKLGPENRGWTLDVLLCLRSLNRKEFTLSNVYDKAENLGALHPKNLHVRAKIRQQLQVLRDLGLITFRGGGAYRLR